MLLIFLGIMMGQLLYMCTLWLQHKKKEYAFYVVHYVIFIYFLLGLGYEYLFTKEYIQEHFKWFRLLLFQPLHIFNYFLYIKFAQYFLETKTLYPRHNRQAVKMMKGVWVCTGISIICWFIFGPQNNNFKTIYLVLSFFLMVWALWLVYLIYTMHTRQSGYLFRGTSLLSVGIFTTYILISFAEAGVISRTIAIFYPSILGVLGEIYFVTAGLNYKASLNRKQLINTQQQLITGLQQNGILLHDKENIRNNLSLQLNKEVGITLNGISLFAEHSLEKLKAGEILEVENILGRIVNDSNLMVSGMSDIVWMLTPDNDSLDKTVQWLHRYTTLQSRKYQLNYNFINKSDGATLHLEMEERGKVYRFYRNMLDHFTALKPEELTIRLSPNGYELHFLFEIKGYEIKGMGEWNADMPNVYISRNNYDQGLSRLGFVYKLTRQGDTVL